MRIAAFADTESALEFAIGEWDKRLRIILLRIRMSRGKKRRIGGVVASYYGGGEN